MTGPLASDRPRLADGCRLGDARGHEATLLMPEGALRLNGPGLKIVQLCDGTKTISEILQKLEALFPGAGAQRIEEDTILFLESLRDARVLDFV